MGSNRMQHMSFPLMDLSFDILDHIFGFLRSHPQSLIACSEAHPDFSPIAERHQYYHTIIHTGSTQFAYSFKPIRLLELISETPRIVNHVRVLEIEFNRSQNLMTPGLFLEDIALVLPRFPLIECFILSSMVTNRIPTWQELPQSLRTAVEGCLHLPTLQEVHIGDLEFPLSLLSHPTNINLFSLTGHPQIAECPDVTYPQLKTLSITGFRVGGRFTTWAKRRISNLQSLQCTYRETSLRLLEDCLDTLQNLYIQLWDRDYATTYDVHNDLEVEEHGSPILINLSSLRHLQHLTIVSEIYFDEGDDEDPFKNCISFLPAVIEILKTASSLEHVKIELFVDSTSTSFANLDAIDFSPLTVLADSCAPFHHIDIYIWASQKLDSIVSLLETFEGLRKLIDQGTLVIHEDVTAPTFFDTVYSRSTLVQHPWQGHKA